MALQNKFEEHTPIPAIPYFRSPASRCSVRRPWWGKWQLATCWRCFCWQTCTRHQIFERRLSTFSHCISWVMTWPSLLIFCIIESLEYLNLIIHKQEPDSRQLEGAVEEKAVEGEAEGVRPSRLRDPWGCHQTGGSQLIKLVRDLTLQILSFGRKAFLSRGNATNRQKRQNIQSASLFKFCDTKIIYRLDTQSKHISEISSQIVWNGSEA